MGCTALENVTLGNDIFLIDSDAFTYCNNIKYNEKDGLKYLGSEDSPYLYLMGVVSKDITTATIDSTCILINSYAFIGCTLENVFIPTATPKIMANAFNRCTLSTATFEKKSRWNYGLMGNITSSDLSNESTAATYLTSTYVGEAWARYD